MECVKHSMNTCQTQMMFGIVPVATRLEQLIYIHDCCTCIESCSLDVSRDSMRCNRCWRNNSTVGLRVVEKLDFLTVEFSTLVVIIGVAANAGEGVAPALEISDRFRRRTVPTVWTARLVAMVLKVGDRGRT